MSFLETRVSSGEGGFALPIGTYSLGRSGACSVVLSKKRQSLSTKTETYRGLGALEHSSIVILPSYSSLEKRLVHQHYSIRYPSFIRNIPLGLYSVQLPYLRVSCPPDAENRSSSQRLSNILHTFLRKLDPVYLNGYLPNIV